MTEASRCPQCEAELAPDAPAGLCPECLLKQGLESQDSEAGAEVSPASGPFAPTTPQPAGFVPPEPEEIAPYFPQLEILELLGHGGMGAVYKARQPGLDRFVAVKILPPDVAQDPSFAERFTREARALAKFNHPNIVAVYDSGHTGDFYYFVMELVEGANLRQTLEAGRLEPKEALAIVSSHVPALHLVDFFGDSV